MRGNVGRRVLGVLVVWGLLASVAQATLPSNELWREGLLNYRVGYGRLATGGAGGSLCTVSTLNDAGANSLRDCVTRSGPQWIIFSVSGTINLASTLAMQGFNNNHDKTIDGRGANIIIASADSAFQLSAVHNWIIHNVAFIGVHTWSLRFLGGSQTIWIDHVTLSDNTDGVNTAVSIGGWGGETDAASRDITISWSQLIKAGTNDRYILCGPDFGATDHLNTRVTLHHNWYNHSYVRHPEQRYCRTHSFNNYFDQNTIGSQTADDGQMLSENDIYNGQPGGYPRMTCTAFVPPEPDTPGGNCKVVGQWSVTGAETYAERNPGTTWTPSSDYSYTLETANAALRTALTDTTTGAGRVDNPYQTVTVPGAVLLVKLVMGEGTGTSVADTSGNALTGQLCEGTTCPAAGPVWQAQRLLFDGVNDGVKIPANALFGVTGDLTIGMRVNFDNLTNGNGLCAKTSVGQAPYDWVFWLEANTLCFAFGGSAPGLLCSTGTLTDLANEHLVAVTRAGTTVTFWIDGVSAGSGTMTGTMSNNSVPVWFGTDTIGYLLGTMRDARIYTGALTQAQLAAWQAESLVLNAPTNLRVVP